MMRIIIIMIAVSELEILTLVVLMRVTVHNRPLGLLMTGENGG